MHRTVPSCIPPLCVQVACLHLELVWLQQLLVKVRHAVGFPTSSWSLSRLSQAPGLDSPLGLLLIQLAVRLKGSLLLEKWAVPLAAHRPTSGRLA